MVRGLSSFLRFSVINRAGFTHSLSHGPAGDSVTQESSSSGAGSLVREADARLGVRLGVTVRDCGPEGCVDGRGLQRETGLRQGSVALISVQPGKQQHVEFQPQVGEPGCWPPPGGEGKSWRGGGYGHVTIHELSRLPYICSTREHWTVRESACLRDGRASLDV